MFDSPIVTRRSVSYRHSPSSCCLHSTPKSTSSTDSYRRHAHFQQKSDKNGHRKPFAPLGSNIPHHSLASKCSSSHSRPSLSHPAKCMPSSPKARVAVPHCNASSGRSTSKAPSSHSCSRGLSCFSNGSAAEALSDTVVAAVVKKLRPISREVTSLRNEVCSISSKVSSLAAVIPSLSEGVEDARSGVAGTVRMMSEITDASTKALRVAKSAEDIARRTATSVDEAVVCTVRVSDQVRALKSSVDTLSHTASSAAKCSATAEKRTVELERQIRSNTAATTRHAELIADLEGVCASGAERQSRLSSRVRKVEALAVFNRKRTHALEGHLSAIRKVLGEMVETRAAMQQAGVAVAGLDESSSGLSDSKVIALQESPASSPSPCVAQRPSSSPLSRPHCVRTSAADTMKKSRSSSVVAPARAGQPATGAETAATKAIHSPHYEKLRASYKPAPVEKALSSYVAPASDTVFASSHVDCAPVRHARQPSEAMMRLARARRASASRSPPSDSHGACDADAVIS